MLRSLASLALVVLAACAGPETEADEETGASDSALLGSGTFRAKATAYYPDASPLEGGFVDRKGARLRTLQQFLAGDAEYVSVAMDTKAFAYGQKLRIRELEAKYGRPIEFRVVDTGGAFKGKGKTRIDVCVANRKASLDASVNGTLTIDVVSAVDVQRAPAQEEPMEQEPVAEDEPGGAACASDGACNPGNDGSGLICVSGRCVQGCRAGKNQYCPGSTTCREGMCR